MSYRKTEPGERGLQAEMGQFNLPGGWPGFPGMLPGPPMRHEGAPGPNVPAGLFPTHTRVGDVVMVTGPFGGFGQGQVRVKFQGAGWLSPQIMGPTSASVVVPEGAETGLCEIEINGRRVFGTNCVIDRGQVRVGQPSHGRDTRAWNWAGGELVQTSGTKKPLQGYLGAMPANVVQTALILAATSYGVRAVSEQFYKGDYADDIKTYSTWGYWGFITIAFLGAFGVIHD